ncbi:MAG: alanine--tRNA ligase [Actinomycetia bacterium]|nr:alanine--tRNA ligase [Actinomycetes bacterium]
MNANELRQVFTEFFVERDHQALPSASLIPHDSSLLFVNSGMVPFKPYFLGEERPDHPRAVTVQKCVRAGGKHNDLDEVGRTKRHLTFFEMMGNFSFGDYFKEQAIPQAWEFFTEVLGLDPERLWVTVHLTDDEAEEIWAEEVGVPRERIQRLDEDNWWRMADTGPNGPCSEIFWDKGPDYGPTGGPANPEADERYVEIWNLVFMQFETDESGESTPLPKPSIDTGAGLERVLSVLQGVDSVFEIDEMQRLLATAEQTTGAQYGADERSDFSLRVLAEHARTMTFLITDGVFPSNEDRGYVLRRIMRRAIRHAYLLGVNDIVTPALVDTVVEVMGPDYPELVASHQTVRGIVEREEKRFRETLRTGSGILDDRLSGLTHGDVLPGEVAFLLHDTYGFPLEVTQEVAAERGVEVDQPGFDAAMAEQRERAKAARKEVGADTDLAVFQELVEQHGVTDFVGRTEITDVAGTVLGVTGDADTGYSVFLDRSPFYAESGGQIGDTGTITTDTGRARVIDTLYALPGLHRHRVELEGELEAGQSARLSIDVERRDAIRRNHTATHLMHWALREVVGDHVQQQGSMVAPDRLRFDFSHYEPLTVEQVASIEDLVNTEVLGNPAARNYETSMAEAEAAGAIAFFGDKYGDMVRVLEAGPSVELCGGTHVGALGDIGAFKIVSEGSIGSNLRRVEAITGLAPIHRLRDEEAVLHEAAELLGVAFDEVVEGLEKRLGEMKELRTEVKGLRQKVALGAAADLAASAVDGRVVARVDGIGRDELRELAVAIRGRDGVTAVVLGGAPEGGGAALVSAVATDTGFAASDLIADAAKTIKGGGGKNAEVAMAGGKDPEALDQALDQVRVALGL